MTCDLDIIVYGSWSDTDNLNSVVRMGGLRITWNLDDAVSMTTFVITVHLYHRQVTAMWRVFVFLTHFVVDVAGTTCKLEGLRILQNDSLTLSEEKKRKKVEEKKCVLQVVIAKQRA